MKKVILFFVSIFLFLTIIPSNIERISAAAAFKDVPPNAWYHKHVGYFENDSRQIMTGYNGSFFPLDSLTVDQFIKIIVTSTGYKASVPSGNDWAEQYIKKGLESGIVINGEFTDYQRPITRGEMARMIVRALSSITGEKDISYDINDIKSKMGDYEIIKPELRDYVCKAYKLGILTGDTSGRFNPDNGLIRAEAAAVVHRMLVPSTRQAVSQKEGWTDAEFEAFMRSAEASEYVNTILVSKIENRKIYWKPSAGQTPVLIPETYNPGVNDMVYNIVKIMAYHTKKVGGYIDMIYSDKYFGGTFLIQFYVSETVRSFRTAGDISLWIYAKPDKCPTANTYFPGQQKGVIHYEWILGVLHNDKDIEGYKPGMDRTKFVWTAPRYEEIFKQMCIEVYGYSQGLSFFNYALKENDNVYDIEKYKAKYIGFNQEIGAEIIYNFPDSVKLNRFWTGRPEERK